MGRMNPLVLAIFFLLSIVKSDAMIGCFSSVSSASSKGTYTWQSPSYCAGECSGYSYYALREGNECYCLNSQPSSSNKVSSSECDVPCTGYGTMNCGGSNAYGVYSFEDSASDASSNADSSATSDSSSPSSSASEGDSSSRMTSTTSSTTKSTTSSSTQDSSTDSSSSTFSPSSTSSLPSASVTHQVIASTSSGDKVIYKTITSNVTPTASSSSSATSSSPTSSSGSRSGGRNSNVGPIVGGVVGGVAGALILAFAIFFFIRKRKSNEEVDEEEFYEKSSGLGRGGTSKSKYGKSPLDMPMTNPFTHPSEVTVAAGAGGDSGLADPRLNPIMMGRRRLSDGSLADEADYSRKILSVANPDS